jgi:hypothetical protein
MAPYAILKMLRDSHDPHETSVTQPLQNEIELKELNAGNIRPDDLKRLPRMTGWFEPVLLIKLLWRVIVSDLFGQYADRRLMEAALDAASNDEHIRRAKIGPLAPDNDGATWIDYVSDLGDGFDATYAIAYLLAQPSIKVDGRDLPRGAALFMGGDEVYPTSLRDDYKVKMRLPYDLAWPVPWTSAHTPLFLLPGNHDWYDGLVTFLSIFCREKATRIGGWETIQRRSYFAAEVAPNWWVWGIDIALVRDMDQPQADYFVAIAKAMPEHTNIILCSAEPGWYKAEARGDAYRTLSYASQIARNAKRDLRIPLVLSGDSHHYARYAAETGTQYITSGGGGGFLHGTLELKDSIDAPWLQSARENLTLATCYPSKAESADLLKGNRDFGRLNKGLTWTIAGFYVACAFILASLPRADVACAMFLILFATLWGYLRYQESSWQKTVVVSGAHAFAHFAAVVGFAAVGCSIIRYLGLDAWHWLARLAAVAAPVALIGPWLAGKIYGFSLWIGCKHFDLSHNDAFSSMQLDSHRHFLRIRLKGDEATVFAVKLDRVPQRNGWTENPDRGKPGASVFIAKPPLEPRFVEGPIVIHARTTTKTGDVKTPDQVPDKNPDKK